jgi:hypothetical protein
MIVIPIISTLLLIYFRWPEFMILKRIQNSKVIKLRGEGLLLETIISNTPSEVAAVGQTPTGEI